MSPWLVMPIALYSLVALFWGTIFWVQFTGDERRHWFTFPLTVTCAALWPIVITVCSAVVIGRQIKANKRDRRQ